MSQQDVVAAEGGGGHDVTADETSVAEKPLNARQRRFAEELAVSDSVDEAYAKAGFRPHRGNARRLAADPRIRKLVRDATLIAAELAGVHLGRILVELQRIGMFNIDDLVAREANGRVKVTEEVCDEDGNLKAAAGLPTIDFSGATRDHLAAIAEIDHQTGKVKFHDKLGALRDLLKYVHGERVQVTHEAGPTVADLLRAIDGKTKGLPRAS